MKNKLRKGLQDIPTHSNLTDEAQNPQRKFLRAASLELKKSLCEKVRDAARRRAREMDKKIAELEAEKAQLLGENPGAAPNGRLPAGAGPAQRRGLTLRY